MTGMINEEEPGVWGPDAKLQMRVGSVSVTVKQHTEGPLAESRSMMDPSVDGLASVLFTMFAVGLGRRCTGCR